MPFSGYGFSQFAHSIDPRNSTKNFLLVIIIIIGAGGLIRFVGAGSGGPGGPGGIVTPTPAPARSVSGGAIVYGTWSEQNSNIKLLDIGSGKEYLLAKLPTKIKKVTLISPTQLLFINDTDNGDHGKEIVVFDTTNKTTRTVFKAENDFGIDDYVVSPDKRLIADWEVRLGPDGKTLYGGKSRVYSAEIGSQAKNLIYQEDANAPVHYPLSITNTGTIYLDRFLPNDSAGWAYGMSVSDFKGTQKQDITQITNGTYASQPVLSPDGSKLAFIGYDGADGITVQDGFRTAILKSNTVEIFDTATSTRLRLPNLRNANVYSSLQWDKSGNHLIFVMGSRDSSDSGTYTYDLSTQAVTKVELGEENSVITAIPGGYLLGQPDTSPTTLGNLGSGYASSLQNLFILDFGAQTVSPARLSDVLVQYIDTTPASYFSESYLAGLPSGVDANGAKRNLQLQTFEVKASLAPARIGQQSLPRCRDLIAQMCGVDPVRPKDAPPAAKACFQQLANQAGGREHICYDSPLYVYAPAGTKLTVRVQTPVLASDAVYQDGYDITSLENGRMRIGGKIYDKINFDYKPAAISRPTAGIVVSKEQFEKTLVTLARSVGLNEQEANDLVDQTLPEITSPYVFISYFDQKQSEQILPMSFAPEPDTFINRVFYFKKLEHPPVFYTPLRVNSSPPARGETTAVEVSWIIE